MADLCAHHVSVLRAAARQHDHDPAWLAHAEAEFRRQCRECITHPEETK